MAYLPYITDEQLTTQVKAVLDKAREKVAKADSTFNKNVIDPFSALLGAAAFELNHAQWKSYELIRQSQKTLENHVGTLHQNLLGEVQGWQDLGTGSVVDLINSSQKIVAEVKNKHNTVSGGKLVDVYNDLHGTVMPKNSQYHGYTAYLVQIVPKTPGRYNKPFTPPDKKTGGHSAVNDKIRVIDGASFYELVTGQPDALEQLYQVLPKVIEQIYREKYSESSYHFPDAKRFSHYFDLAYKK